jgi:hypothetical protein
MEEKYVKSLRAMHAALKNYLLLIGEPCPLIGKISFSLVEIIGTMPPGEESQADNFDKLTAVILESAIMGICDRLADVSPRNACLRSVDDCMKIAAKDDMSARCVALFKILGIAMDGLRNATNIEYPELADGAGKKLTGR